MNYRKNEDRLCNNWVNNFNAIHNVEDITGSGTITEPVSLQEVKDYLRLGTFSFDDDSPADEFDYDDLIVDSMITEARMWVEKFTGVHLISKTLQVTLTNGTGMMNIPGPVTGTISWADQDGNSLDAATLIGSLFPKIQSATDQIQVIEYEAGYGIDCPEWAKNAIKAYIADHYEFRGDDEPPAANLRAAQICRPHRRLKLFS